MSETCFPDEILKVMGFGIALMLLRPVSRYLYYGGIVLSIGALIAVFAYDLE